MEFEDKQTSPPAEPAQSAGENTQFLQSMGFGEEELRELEADSAELSEEEVALSSLPDDLEVPGAGSNSSIGPRVVGVQIGNTAKKVEEDGRIDLSPVRISSEQEPKGSSPESENEEDSAKGSTEMEDPNLLHLHCPSCDEELVLRKEHVGVEGACVWCDTKIVAARSGLEAEVKVFALEAPKTPAREEEALAEATPEVEAPSEDVNSEAMPWEEAPSEVVGFESPEESKDEDEDEVEVENEEENPVSESAETSDDETFSSWAPPAEEVEPQDSEDSDLTESEDSPPAFSGWSGMAPLQTEEKEKEEPPIEVPNGFNEASLENEDSAPQPVAEEPSTGFASAPSPWGEALDSGDSPEEEKTLQDNEVSPDAADSEEESPDPIGFVDLDFAPDPEDSAPDAKSAIAEGFAPSPFSGDTPPSEETGFLSAGTDGIESPFAEEAPSEETENVDALDTLFGSSPKEASAPEGAVDTDASPAVLGGFESPSPSPEEGSPSSWEGSIGSSESPSIEPAPLPVPEEPFSSATPDAAPMAPANETVQEGFGAPSGFSMAEPSELADAAPEPVSTPAPASDFEAGFASPAPLEDPEASTDGFQIPTSQPHDFSQELVAGPAPESAPFPSPAPEVSAETMPLSDSPSAPPEWGDSAPESPFFSDEMEEPAPTGELFQSSPAESLFSESPAEPTAQSESPPSLFSETPAAESAPSPFEEAMSEAPAAESAPSPFEEAMGEAPAAESAPSPFEEAMGEAPAAESAPSPFEEAMGEAPAAESAPSPFEEAMSEAPAAESALSPFEEAMGEAPAAESAPSPFEEAMSEAPAAESAPSPFEEAMSEAPATPPALPASETEASSAVFGEESPSSEISAPEKKKKSKVKGPRKGLVVMLVVLIGFVCGAALASFVLPVDQYVLKARNYMEEKFNPGEAVLNQDLLPSRGPSSVSVGDSQP